MERVGEHQVPVGPLAIRWRAIELPEFRAGEPAHARVALQNAGSAPWAGEDAGSVRLSYHWLDELGNPIFWDGVRSALGRRVEPGGELELDFELRGPIPPGRYRLAVDLVQEGRFWFAELGNEPLEREVEVAPRLRRRALAVRVEGQSDATADALARQEEALVAEDEAEAVAVLADGCLPGPDWSSRVLDAHSEGYAVVAGSIEVERRLGRRQPAELAAYAPGSGRIPGFSRPLLCPSALVGTELTWVDPVAGLPAADAPDDEPWLYDGRLILSVSR